MEIKSICVFCGSSTGVSPVFAAKAALLGRIIAEGGMNLVYGGGNIGLMEITAREALKYGAEVTGVIPQLIHRRVKPLEGIKTIVTPSMHERKAKMYKLSDAFIALPGGLGTLEELLEIFTWKHLGYHEKSVAILNTLGYYDGLLAFMEKAVESGFLKRKHMESLIVSEDPQQLLALVREHEHQSVDKWDN